MIVAAIAWPAVAPGRGTGGAVSISGLRNADGTYVDGVLVDTGVLEDRAGCRVDGGRWNDDPNVWVSGEGTHTVSFLRPADDDADGWERDSVTFIIRSPRPVTTPTVFYGIKGANGGYIGRLDLELKVALDWPSGRAKPSPVTEYSVDGSGWRRGTSIALTTPGTHSVRYRSRYYPSWRPVEVVEEVRSAVYAVGTPVPTTTAAVQGTPYGDGVYLGPVYVSLGASVAWPEESSPSLTTEYSLDGGQTWTTGMGVEIAAEGSTTLQYRSSYVQWNVLGRVVEPPQVLTVQIENPLPSTSASVCGRAGSNGWYTSPVVVSLNSRTPDRTPVDSTEYCMDGVTWTPYAGPFGVSAEGTTTILYRSSSLFGGVEPDKSLTVRIDTTPPRIESVSPDDDLTLALGGAASARWRTVDTVSGTAREWGSTEEGTPLDTTSVGVKSLVFGATDAAGNEAWAWADYRVEYEWGGYSPLTPVSAERGSAVPVRFSLHDDSGDTATDARATLAVAKISDLVHEHDWMPCFSGAADRGGACTYDAGTGLYGVDLDTTSMSRGTYRLTVRLDDGTEHAARLSVH